MISHNNGINASRPPYYKGKIFSKQSKMPNKSTSKIFEAKIPEILGKIIISLVFWVCVAISFPIIAMLAFAIGASTNFQKNYFLEIIGYFDGKLFTGIALGGILFGIIVFILIKIFRKIDTNYDGDVAAYVRDEFLSQIMGVGSIIITSKIMSSFSEKIFGNYAAPPDKIDILNYWWLGLVCWLVTAIGIYLSDSATKGDEAKSTEKRDNQVGSDGGHTNKDSKTNQEKANL
ncbi:hypothetical protein [Burkholderia glumae]|uniref:hypothetical protein n=1 Tax=Burkholderia glumae TaxID=337 RepID=UPI001462856F|nr:hypothetical protein [Burkholderia glumae]QJP72083.1 hypothetical protein HJC54_18175 [Burkholderia glumae]